MGQCKIVGVIITDHHHIQRDADILKLVELIKLLIIRVRTDPLGIHILGKEADFLPVVQCAVDAVQYLIGPGVFVIAVQDQYVAAGFRRTPCREKDKKQHPPAGQPSAAAGCKQLLDSKTQ